MPAPCPTDSANARLSYARMRLLWCRGALVDLLRRWAAYLVVGVMVLGSSGNGALAAMSGLAAWSVFPLFRATTQSLALLAAMAVVHSCAGAVVVWGLRPLLWPRQWVEAESALPIDPRDRLRSDIAVTGFALAPLLCAYAAGALVWRAQSPPWMHGEWGAAVAALVVSTGLSLLWGVLIVRNLRHRPPSLSRARAATPSAHAARMSVLGALVVAPLLRGPARRSARMLMLGTAVLLGANAALWCWPARAAWWLAAFAALSLIVSTRLNVLVSDELAPLHQHAASLPISLQALLRARRLLALLPQFVGQAALCLLVNASGQGGMRPLVFIADMLALLAGSGAQVVFTTQVDGHRATDPAHRVSYWLFTLVLGVVLATEVFP